MSVDPFVLRRTKTVTRPLRQHFGFIALWHAVFAAAHLGFGVAANVCALPRPSDQVFCFVGRAFLVTLAVAAKLRRGITADKGTFLVTWRVAARRAFRAKRNAQLGAVRVKTPFVRA